MATGTGKTITCIGLIYRLIKAKCFRRVFFLVDRYTLGEQAVEKCQEVRLENLQTFADIYEVKELGDLSTEPDTRLHIATVQGMIQRLFYPSEEDRPCRSTGYDCVVVDECHRGYVLDREMCDAELTFRSEHDYISRYRRVLDHLDAVRIGLTATPALHTALFSALLSSSTLIARRSSTASWSTTSRRIVSSPSSPKRACAGNAAPP